MGAVLILFGVPAFLVIFTWLLAKCGPNAALSFAFFFTLAWATYVSIGG